MLVSALRAAGHRLFEGICASIYTNSLPFITRDKAWKLYGDFEEAVYAELT